MKKVFLTLFAILILLSGNQASAVSIDIFQSSPSADNGWISSIGGAAGILGGGDFSGSAAGWYTSLNVAGLGTFKTEDSLPGIGATSFKQIVDPNSTTPYFQVRNAPHTPPYGRENHKLPGGNYLDSADITKLTLELSAQVTNLFFYIQDPSDVGADTWISVNTFRGESAVEKILLPSDPSQNNGKIWFVGISDIDASDFISSIVWETFKNSSSSKYFKDDGHGLVNFSTVRVSEPTAMLLLGLGLIGLASVSRRRFR